MWRSVPQIPHAATATIRSSRSWTCGSGADSIDRDCAGISWRTAALMSSTALFCSDTADTTIDMIRCPTSLEGCRAACFLRSWLAGRLELVPIRLHRLYVVGRSHLSGDERLRIGAHQVEHIRGGPVLPSHQAIILEQPVVLADLLLE